MIFANKKPIYLFLILCFLPVLGFVCLQGTPLGWFSWLGLSLLLATRWQYELQITINKYFNESLINLQLVNLAYYFLSVLFLLTTFSILNIDSIDEYVGLYIFSLIGGLVLVPFLWTTARLINIAIGKDSDSLLPTFGHFIALIYFPIGIWTIQSKILRKADNRR
jgi:hypothetical protein